MASIKCPRCGNSLHHFSIDVVSSGGALAGAGGITCPSCNKQIPNSEIERLVRGIPTILEMQRLSEERPSWFRRLFGSFSERRERRTPSIEDLEARQKLRGLIKALRHPSAEVRREAVEAVARVGGKNVSEPLIGCLEDWDSTVRFLAARALARFGPSQALAPGAEEAIVHVFVDALQSPYEPLKRMAKQELKSNTDLSRRVQSVFRGRADAEKAQRAADRGDSR